MPAASSFNSLATKRYHCEWCASSLLEAWVYLDFDYVNVCFKDHQNLSELYLIPNFMMKMNFVSKINRTIKKKTFKKLIKKKLSHSIFPRIFYVFDYSIMGGEQFKISQIWSNFWHLEIYYIFPSNLEIYSIMLHSNVKS